MYAYTRTVRVRLFGETILFIILLYLWPFFELNDVYVSNEMEYHKCILCTYLSLYFVEFIRWFVQVKLINSTMRR